MNDQMNTDLYEVLGVATDATAKEITKTYKKLARELHPDVNPDDAAAEDRFKAVTAAYDVLGDADKRAEYDEFRTIMEQGFGPSGPRTGGAHGGATASDIEDLLAQMMGGRAQGSRGFGQSPFGPAPFGQRQHPATLMANVSISFADAVRGTTITLEGPDGPMHIAIPAGVEDGAQIVVARDHEQVVLQVAVGADARFGRSGPNLTLTTPISITEAALGATVRVPTFDGKPVGIKVPAGTPHGRTFRVAGKGVKTETRTGDLLVTVEVITPTDLTDEQRELLQQFADIETPIKHRNRVQP